MSQNQKQTLNICCDVFLRNCRDFKAYDVTAVMNKLTYVFYHKVGSEQSSGEVGNFVANLLQYLCPKNIEI